MVVYSTTLVGNNSSLGAMRIGNFTIPGAAGHVAVVLIELRTNISASLMGGSVSITLPDGTLVANTEPPTNGTGVAVVAPTGSLKAVISVGTSGNPFGRGVPFSATVTIIDQGIISTS